MAKAKQTRVKGEYHFRHVIRNLFRKAYGKQDGYVRLYHHYRNVVLHSRDDKFDSAAGMFQYELDRLFNIYIEDAAEVARLQKAASTYLARIRQQQIPGGILSSII
jgi:hypothetical protein